MSLLDGSNSQEVEQFGGAKPLLDPSDLAIGDAATAFNCEFFPKRVQPRRGFASAFSPTRVVQSMKYWAQGQSGSPTQYLIYLHDHTTLTLRNLSTAVETDILTGLTDNSISVIAPYGQRLYAAILSAAGFGSHPGFVWDGNLAHTMDNTFQRPMLTTEVSIALSQPGAGVCTSGLHSVGVIFETRSGYFTRPGPAANTAALTLTPSTFTSDGSHNMQAVVTPTGTWPTWIKAVQIIYTTVANSFQYYVVPGTLTSVTAGGAGAATITWNITDAQLRSIGSQGAGTDATEFFDLLSMDNSNNAPFNVKFVVAWGNRIVWFGNYGGIDSFFPSDPGNPETITPDQHILNLPGGLPISTAFVLRGILYVCSSIGGIFAFLDNGGRPVTFSPAQAVELSVSVPAPLGVTVDDNGSGYAVLAAQQGMFIFPGLAMPDIPLSYYAGPDWDQIDWTSQTSIEVKVHQQDRLFMVLAKQQSGNVRIYTFNYLNGRTPEKIKYSLWYPGGAYPTSCMEILQNVTKSVWEVYLGPSVAAAGNPVLRQMSTKAGDSSTVLYADNTSNGIDWQYVTAPMPDIRTASMRNHIGLRVRSLALQATANLYVQVLSLDGTNTITPLGTPLALINIQDKHNLLPYDFTNEVALYKFHNNIAANNAPTVTWFEHFSTLLAAHR